VHPCFVSELHARLEQHTANLLTTGQPLCLATDETDLEFLQPFKDRFDLIQFSDLASATLTPYHWAGIVETLICAAAPERFMGTRLSTLSARIATLRGHLSITTGIDAAIYYTQAPLWSGSQEPYSKPTQKHIDEFGETDTPWWVSMYREPIWGRAYRSTWTETQ